MGRNQYSWEYQQIVGRPDFQKLQKCSLSETQACNGIIKFENDRFVLLQSFANFSGSRKKYDLIYGDLDYPGKVLQMRFFFLLWYRRL